MFERKGPFGAIGRSAPTRGVRWRTSARCWSALLITFVLQLVLLAAGRRHPQRVDGGGELTAAIVLTLVNLIPLALTYPPWASVTTVLYYDLRVRNERSTQLLAQGMGADTARFESAWSGRSRRRLDAGGFVPEGAVGGGEVGGANCSARSPATGRSPS